MKIDWNSKYTTISAYTVITFAICLAMVLFVVCFSSITGAIGAAVNTLSSFVWGFVIAFLLNPVMLWTEKLMKKLLEKKKPHPKLCRFISTFFAIIFGIAVISALIAIIVPQVLESIMTIFSNAQNYINNIYNWINTTLAEYPDVANYLNDQLDSIENTILTAVNSLIPKVGDWAVKLKDGAVGFAVGLKDFVIGFIVAVYLLLDKEKFIAQAKKLVTAIFPERVAYEIKRISVKINDSLNGFITGKILDSFIIGMICFVLMTIFKMEFPVLISTIIGVTNIIPFFGPFIGAIPSALLLLISEPTQTLPFIVMIFALQQFDGNILGPHILGDSTGLPAFWVMFAIFLGGGLFGFAGMILGVPIFAVIFALIQEIIESLLTKKGLPTDTDAYLPEPPPQKKSIKPQKNKKST